MSGLLLLFVAGVWFFFVWWLTVFLTRKMPSGAMTTIVEYLLFAVLLVAPLADEIIGRFQFKALCKKNATVTLDTTNTQGRTVWFGESLRTQMTLGTIEVSQAQRRYVDAKTQEPIYHYSRLEAKGGWLIRTLGISDPDSPLLFEGLCQPKNLESIDAQLGLTRINRPTVNQKEIK